MTTDTGMVETLARAIFDAEERDDEYPIDIVTWEHTTDNRRNRSRQIARAVLECLRTPTPEMVEAMAFMEFGSGFTDADCLEVSDLFVCAIDRALYPSKGEGE